MFVGLVRKSVSSPTATEATPRMRKNVIQRMNKKLEDLFAASMYFFFRSRFHALVFTTATRVGFAIALSLFRTGASAWSVQLKSGMQARYQIGRRLRSPRHIAPKPHSPLSDQLPARTLPMPIRPATAKP